MGNMETEERKEEGTPSGETLEAAFGKLDQMLETLESSDWVEFKCPDSISSSMGTTEAKPVVFSDDSELPQEEPANETNDSGNAGESNEAAGEPQTYEGEAGSGF